MKNFLRSLYPQFKQTSHDLIMLNFIYKKESKIEIDPLKTDLNIHSHDNNNF